MQAEGGALANAASGAVLWSRGMDTERPMGSITKVMTAIVVLQAGDLHRLVGIPKGVLPYDRKYDASNAGLHPGDYLTTRELLEALLLPSGCDAAYALAKSYGPGWTAFIAKMNATAERMGLAHTHFSNFDGLPWPTETSTYSTPRDLIALGRKAMGYPVFRSIVGQQTYHLAAAPRHHAYVWHTTNMLLNSFPGAFGIKTGEPSRPATACCSRPARTAMCSSAWSCTARAATTWPPSAMPRRFWTGASGTFSLQGLELPARFH